MSDFWYTPIGDMASAAYQGEVASHGANTPEFFVSPGVDLAAKVGSNQDSWFLTSHLVVQAQARAQEFRSPVGNHKYEASAPVTGTLHGEPISDYAVIELVGDRA